MERKGDFECVSLHYSKLDHIVFYIQNWIIALQKKSETTPRLSIRRGRKICYHSIEICWCKKDRSLPTAADPSKKRSISNSESCRRNEIDASIDDFSNTSHGDINHDLSSKSRMEHANKPPKCCSDATHDHLISMFLPHVSYGAEAPVVQRIWPAALPILRNAYKLIL